jgi:hypothetical protein
MEIAGDPWQPAETKWAALIQLELAIRQHWNSKKMGQLGSMEKKHILEMIAPTIRNLAPNHLLIRLLKKVFSVISFSEQPESLPAG